MFNERPVEFVSSCKSQEAQTLSSVTKKQGMWLYKINNIIESSKITLNSKALKLLF